MTVVSEIVSPGGFVSTQNGRANTGPTLPAPSIARTEKMTGPFASVASVCGDVHGLNAAGLTLHWKVEPGSSDKNSNVGVLSALTPW